ncbi:hypothetical protein ACFQYP_17570 [Nonomuraea antimicrobica]
MLLDHARMLILGLGVSGEAAAVLGASRNAPVTVTDTRSRDDLAPALARPAPLPISYHLGSPPPGLDGFTLLVRSPGVPCDLPVLVEAHRRGCRCGARSSSARSCARTRSPLSPAPTASPPRPP